VVQKLGEDGLSGIHPPLSTISVVGSYSPIAAGSAAINFKSKNESYTLSRVLCDHYSERPDFSRTLLSLDSPEKSISTFHLMCLSQRGFGCAVPLSAIIS
jgi:hypothetical protein